MGEIAPFEDFYAATHGGRAPFPWQSRLARRVADEGWPDEIGVPTGLGKTACLDVAVWALAAQAGRDPRDRTAATRTWYVVNRRLLVDQAFDHGMALCRWLREPELLREDRPRTATDGFVEAIRSVGEVLARISRVGSEQGPLHITRLRGGADIGARVPDPSQPALVFSTVPMFASRWLFRGYGSSPSMRPVDAALAGIDTLVLLDEAHLARPLARLTGPLAQCDPGNPERLLSAERARPRLVALTATGEAKGDRFDLDGDDLGHPVVRERVDAAKAVRLESSKRKTLTADLAKQALRVVEEAADPTTCLVFVNTPENARAVHRQIVEQTGDSAEVLLLTGRMREREASRVRDRLLDPATGAPSDRDRGLRDRSLIAVATQTLEVGADVDFDHLVTETAGVRAITQRFGRVNRLGRAAGATATVVHPTDEKDWPVYGTEPAAVWERLTRAAGDAVDAELSLSPGAIGEILGAPEDEPPPVAELLPHHLWDWAKTSLPRRAETPPELFFDQLDDDTRTVSVFWRLYIPAPSLDDDDPRVLVPPMQQDEAIDVPIRVVRQALGEGTARNDQPRITRVAGDGRTVEPVTAGSLRPNDRVVLPAAGGLYDEFGWNPEARGPVTDLSLLRAGLVLEPEVVRALFHWDTPMDGDEGIDTPAGEVPSPQEPGSDAPVSEKPGLGELDAALERLGTRPDPEAEDEDPEELAEQQRAGLAVVRDWLAEAAPPPEVRQDRRQDGDSGEDGPDSEEARWSAWRTELLKAIGKCIRDRGALDRHLTWLADGTPFLGLPAPPGEQRRSRRSAGVRSDAFDDLSFTATSALLDEHLGTVGETAGGVARQVGLLPDELPGVLDEAGGFHDLGKREPRFQRWLDPLGESAEPLAKSAVPWYDLERTRQQSGWPRGGRHELLSARLVADGFDRAGLPPDDPLRDLLLHLVISHHGHGRPLVPVVEDREPARCRAEVRGQEVDVTGDLSQPDWDQPARFHRLCATYGYWGLALLEAIVRQADHAASSAVAETTVEVA